MAADNLPSVDHSGLKEVIDSEVKNISDEQIVAMLEGYRVEAELNRKGGMNNRDDKWEENWNLYWGRYDMSKKAKWQAKMNLPEIPAFVDRYAAAVKEALVSSPDGFYTVVDPADKDQDLTASIKEMTDVWLSRCGRNQVGQLLDFTSVFEEQMKMGAIMACCSTVLWKEDGGHGRVAVETTDPRSYWMDHTFRNLYRIRRIEIDRHQLVNLAKMKDKKGEPLYNLPELSRLTTHLTAEMQTRAEQSSGHGQQTASQRVPIVLDEYLATVLDHQGHTVQENGLYVVANNQFLVRGPEKNPFWHGRDWTVYAPLVTTPLSVYGRSYMEDFGSVAKVFTELTNMILDAVHTSSLKAFAVVPDMLKNPNQVAEGLSPNKLFLLEDGVDAKTFAAALDLGSLPPEAIKVWEALKSELREGAGVNEIGLGQFAPKGRTSAAEVNATQESSSALIRSIAQTVEHRYLNPTLDLIWKTGIQHMHEDDSMLSRAAGEETFRALYLERKELIKLPITFQARGISTLIQRGTMLRALLALLQVIAQNEALMAAFLQEVDLEKLVKVLFELSNINLTKLQATEREKLMKQVAQPMQEMQEQASGRPTSNLGRSQMRDVAGAMGAARGQ